jgi:hypothetical protein
MAAVPIVMSIVVLSLFYICSPKPNMHPSGNRYYKRVWDDKNGRRPNPSELNQDNGAWWSGVKEKKYYTIIIKKMEDIKSHHKDDIDRIKSSFILEKLIDVINTELKKMNDDFLIQFYDTICNITSIVALAQYLNKHETTLLTRYSFNLNEIKYYLQYFISMNNIPPFVSSVLLSVLNLLVNILSAEKSKIFATGQHKNVYVRDMLMSYGVKKSSRKNNKKRRSKHKKV